VVRNAIRSLLAEPRVPNPPVRVWRDWALVGVLLPTALLEGVLREHVAWRPVALVLGMALVFTLLWRRTQPLAMVSIAFGAFIAVDCAAIVGGHAEGAVGLDTNIYVLLLSYALFRWASGRDAAIGLVIMLVAAALGTVVADTGAVDAVFGTVFLLFPAVLGALVRYRTTAHARDMDQVKLRERELLARELHDTVAHHVSAIAIRAQAGRVVATSDPDAALAALDVIEEEASRTLEEMRLMVGALREGEQPDLAPQRGVADIESLARNAGATARVDVELSGDLLDLRPSVGAALYRLAQESITNVVRHARHPTHVSIWVVGDEQSVRLTVSDDGDASGFTGGSSTGYGIAGMTERAKLLGGTLEAGPSRDRGWTVNAVLPRKGAAG
jgi:signal transduction histidine kinase